MSTTSKSSTLSTLHSSKQYHEQKNYNYTHPNDDAIDTKTDHQDTTPPSSDDESKEIDNAAYQFIQQSRTYKQSNPIKSKKSSKNNSKTTQGYSVNVLLGVEKTKRIPWTLPGRFCLKTNMPELLSFRHDPFDDGREDDDTTNLNETNDTNYDNDDASEFTLETDQDRCYIRITLAAVQVPIQTSIKIHIHTISDAMVRGISRSFVANLPHETLHLQVQWSDAINLERPIVPWRRLLRRTSFDRTQLETFANRFWIDTCANGTPGELHRFGFNRLMTLLLRKSTPGHQGTAVTSSNNIKSKNPTTEQLDALWCDFDRDGHERLLFVDLMYGLNRAWNDTHYHQVIHLVEQAKKNDAHAIERDEDDNNATYYKPPSRPNDGSSYSAGMDEEMEDLVGPAMSVAGKKKMTRNVTRKDSVLDFIEDEERRSDALSNNQIKTEITDDEAKAKTAITAITAILPAPIVPIPFTPLTTSEDYIPSSPTRASLHAQHDLRHALAEAVAIERSRRGRNVFAPESVAHLGESPLFFFSYLVPSTHQILTLFLIFYQIISIF